MRVQRPDYIPVCVAGLEVALFGAEEDDRAPVIFVTHGLGGSAVHVYDYCRALAAQGYITVAVEQRNHGRRLVDARGNAFWGGPYQPDILTLIVGTALDVGLLIDALPVATGLKLGRIGMTGFSLGGFATIQALCLEPRIDVGVSFIGACDRRHFAEWRRDRGDFDSQTFAERYTPELDAFVRKYDPIHHAEKLADRPLLLLNGAEDEVVPLAMAERFVAAARPHYTHPERLCLEAHPEVGHEITDAMRSAAAAWFARWLKGA